MPRQLASRLQSFPLELGGFRAWHRLALSSEVKGYPGPTADEEEVLLYEERLEWLLISVTFLGSVMVRMVSEF